VEIQHEEIGRECVVCTDEHPVVDFPDRIATKCQHVAGVCPECLQKTINSSLEGRDWDKIRCPECEAILQYEDVKAHLSQEDFER
jgi:hypothetical protein